MRREGRVVSFLQLLWSGPQAPFLSRYLPPGDRQRDNPPQMAAHDAAAVILLVVAVALAAILVTALVFTVLMPRFP